MGRGVGCVGVRWGGVVLIQFTGGFYLLRTVQPGVACFSFSICSNNSLNVIICSFCLISGSTLAQLLYTFFDHGFCLDFVLFCAWLTVRVSSGFDIFRVFSGSSRTQFV